MNWIYLSPHFDDAAYSCGGLIWGQNQTNLKVSIWTVFAGNPPEGMLSPFALSIIRRWGLEEKPTKFRRNEDILSCQILGAGWHHFEYPDAIYRTASGNFPGSKLSATGHLYPDESSLFGTLNQEECQLIDQIADSILFILKEKYLLDQNLSEVVQLVCPLGLGNHVDHQVTRCAAESLGLPLLYYADFPYVQKSMKELNNLTDSGWRKTVHRISQSELTAWQKAIEAHQSQLGTFWSRKTEMHQAVASYLKDMGGIPLWGWFSA